MYLLKKTVAAVLVCAICIGSSLSFAASNDSQKSTQKFKISAKVLQLSDSSQSLTAEVSTDRNNDKGFSQKFGGKQAEANQSNSKIDLDLSSLKNVVIDDSTPFETQGTVTILGSAYPINAKGDLAAVEVSSGEIVYSGMLKGYINNINDEDNLVLMGINYYPKKDKVAINATFGVVDERNGKFATILSFGEAFPEISKATEKFKDIMGNKKQGLDSNETNNVVADNTTKTAVTNTTNAAPAGSISSDDLSPRLQYTDISCNNSFYVGTFNQNKAYVQTNNEISGKAVVQYDNMKNYIINNYEYGNVPYFECWEAWIKIISADPEYESTTGVTPANGTTGISLTLPLYFGQLGWQFTSVYFTTSSTTVTYSPCVGAPAGRNNIVLWDFYKNFGGFNQGEFSTTSSDPIASSNGLAAKSIYYYRSGVSMPKDFSIGTKATMTLDWYTLLGTKYIQVTGLAGANININPL